MFVIQLELLAGEYLLLGVGIALLDLGLDRRQALVFEAADRVGGRAGQFQQVAKEQGASLFDDRQDFALPFGKGGALRPGGVRETPTKRLSFQPSCSFRTGLGKNAFQSNLRCAAIILADPARELEDLGRDQRLAADGVQNRAQLGRAANARSSRSRTP